MSLLYGRSVSWESKPRKNSCEFTELNYLYLRISCHNIYPISHVQGMAHLQFLFLLFPPVFKQMNDIWHTNHPKVKKSPCLSLNLCVAFPFLFLSLSTATHSSNGAFWAITHLKLPSLIFPFPFSFSCFAPPSLSLSLKNLCSDFLFMLRWRFKDWRGFQNSQISQFLKFNIILKLKK